MFLAYHIPKNQYPFSRIQTEYARNIAFHF